MGIGIGIVGVGSFAQSFIPLFREHPLVDRVALCDIHADRLRENSAKHRIAETYDSLDAACASDLDALVIMTQPWLHAPQAVQGRDPPPGWEGLAHGCSGVRHASRRSGPLGIGHSSFPIGHWTWVTGHCVSSFPALRPPP